MSKDVVSYDYSEDSLQRQINIIGKRIYTDFTKSKQKCVLMIDAAMLRNRCENIRLCEQIKNKKIINIPVAPLYLSSEFEPQLISLDLSTPEDCHILQESVRQALSEVHPEQISQGKGRLICGWLSLTTSLEDVAFHLGKSAIQTKDEQNILLRFYDPSVALPLWSILDDWQQKRLLGAIAFWCSVDGDGQWVKKINKMSSQLRLSYSLSLSPENWRDIDFIEVINRIFCEYRKKHINDKRIPESDMFNFLLPALKRAWGYQFHERNDLIAWGMHALDVSPEFDKHALIKQLVETTNRMTKKDYRQLVSHITEQQWNTIKHDCQAF